MNLVVLHYMWRTFLSTFFLKITSHFSATSEYTLLLFLISPQKLPIKVSIFVSYKKYHITINGLLAVKYIAFFLNFYLFIEISDFIIDSVY
jgi:hypothetical protein